MVPRLHSKQNDNQKEKWAEDMLRHLMEEAVQTASKFMKRCSTSLIVREMQINPSVVDICQTHKNNGSVVCSWGYGTVQTYTFGGNINLYNLGKCHGIA